MRLAFDLPDHDATDALGAALGALLGAGDTLALSGDLGAGKTTLARAIARARGIDPALVSSPTFVIVNQYPAARAGEAPVVHADAYRLASPEDLEPLGWDRLADGHAVVLVEWPERIAGALDAHHTGTLRLAPTGQTARSATLECPDAWAHRDAFIALRALASDAGAPPPRAPTTCPVTGRPVPADAPTWPFADEQARMADLYRWFSGQHQISRPIEQRDIEETE
jgi:tRNA threonylcarbamoyl adenosine modification protein YjeE